LNRNLARRRRCQSHPKDQPLLLRRDEQRGIIRDAPMTSTNIGDCDVARGWAVGTTPTCIPISGMPTPCWCD
jgi:hypothetical protein